MIVVISLNSAIDRTLVLKAAMEYEGVNYVEESYTSAGGRGINIARAIHSLGGRCNVLGFCAGNNGRTLKDTLTGLGIGHDFTEIAGETRVNTQVVDVDGTQTYFNETGPEIARKLKEQGVDIVLCTGGCGTCHRSATIVTRCCEEAGMSCVVIAALPPIARQQGAPRITAPHVPIGSNAGEPNNIPMQTAIIKESLEWVRDCPSYNQTKVLPYEYRHNV